MSDKRIREVKEGVKTQGADEEFPYNITTTPWGSSPTTVVATAYDESVDTVVTTTVFPTNSPSVSGDVITLSPLKALTAGHRYKIKVKFTDGDSVIWATKFFVVCDD